MTRPHHLRGLGPGLVFAAGSVGARDLIANSMAGATYGMGMAWLVVLAIVARYVVLDASARYVLVTGETIISGCGRIGRWPVMALFVMALVRRHVSAITKVLLLGTAAHIVLPLPWPHSVAIWGLISWGAAFGLLFWGRYHAVEALSRPLAVVMAVSVGLIAVLSRPDIGQLVSTLIPRSDPACGQSHDSAFVSMAVLAAALGSFSNLSYPAYLHEKGWRTPAARPSQRADLLLGMGFLMTILLLIQVAAAGVLLPRGLHVEKIEDLTAMFTEFLGDHGRILFGVCLWCASFASTLSNGSGQGIMLADVYHRFISRQADAVDPDGKAGELPAYRWSILFMFCSPLYVFLTAWTPVGLVLAYGVVSVATLPVMGTLILLLTADRGRMGAHVNTWVANLVLVVTILFALQLSWQGLSELFPYAAR